MSPNPDSPMASPRPAAKVYIDPLCRLIPLVLIEAQNAFCRDLPQLLRERKGEYVIYHGPRPIFFAKTYDAVLKEYLRRRLPDDEHVIYCIEEECDLEPIDPAELT